MTDPVTQMEDLVRRAEAGETELVETAREVLADALINGRPVDEKRLEQLAIRGGKNGLNKDTKALMLWSPFVTACSDYIQHKQVGMRDGRCATEDGWDYSNCEPDNIHPTLPASLIYRLETYVNTLSDAEPSNDPERDPSEFDEKFNEVVAQALTEFLDRKGA